MSPRRVSRHWAPLLALAGACTTWHAQALPSPVSPPPGGGNGFRAGFARVDITPPPGVGLAGSGPEGRRSTGYRTRLQAGALVLEDASGERIALVVADLPHVSTNLHRLAAARLVERWGIGADRLIISATHTHSGPGHFYGERQYNESTSRLAGYDPRITDLLVSRIVLAVARAAASTRAATIAWGRVTVPGVTWNRSLPAFCRNREVKGDPACLRRDPTRQVDDTLLMLRIDGLGDALGPPGPMGSYSVFAMHPTAIPSLNTMLDGDAHQRIVERMAARIRDTTGVPTVHLLANGAEGDVAPLVERKRCDLPRPGRHDPVPMPRGPGELVDFIEPPPGQAAECVTHALVEVERLADVVADSAGALYQRLGARLGSATRIRRAFRTEWLPGRDDLCGRGEVGSATAAGAEGLETRIRGWRWLFYPLFRLGLEEGGSAVDRRNRGCQAPKRTLLGPIQAIAVVGEHGFPESAQLTVVRIDSLLLAAVPAELTTTAGRRVRERIAAVTGEAVGNTALIGLANGFLQYVTTREEYAAQHYEGGSGLYGPGMAEFLERRLGELAAAVSVDAGPSPAALVAPITAYPGAPREIMASPRAGPAGPITDSIALRCEAGRLRASWLDLAPGRILPRDSVWVRIEHEASPSDWGTVASDGDGRLELTAAGQRGRGFAWRAELRAPAWPGRLRLVRVADSTSPRRESAPMSCP